MVIKTPWWYKNHLIKKILNSVFMLQENAELIFFPCHGSLHTVKEDTVIEYSHLTIRCPVKLDVLLRLFVLFNRSFNHN